MDEIRGRELGELACAGLERLAHLAEDEQPAARAAWVQRVAEDART
jgi:hypothetical protein